ncbi:hypothetical protein DV515_00012346 [Chloebia gouldiae]|uniref:Uncharacterized protein n=1 Tax=Chloebia gouldiae TaxID=44316 RepID=A0A3L8S3L9_CHLGU|nr:hypothetical protein DV515_00012346 [Chloebia gouldiae]
MCRNPILEKDQPCGVSDTTQGIPKAGPASLSRSQGGSQSLREGDAGTSLPCSQWTSHLVTGHKHASDVSHSYKGPGS